MTAAELFAHFGVEDVQQLLTQAKMGAVGRVDAETHRDFISELGVFFDVTLDGQIVTTDVVWADDKAGRLLLLKRDVDGRAYVDRTTEGPATAMRSGTVRFVLKGGTP